MMKKMKKQDGMVDVAEHFGLRSTTTTPSPTDATSVTTTTTVSVFSAER